MRNKKLLSLVAASALATTMAVPVMAADGGNVDVEFTTKTPVIRVEVPTTILAAVDPLEMNMQGTQIHSGDFTLKNKSEVPVGIDVKSVVDLGTGVTLLDTKAKAVASTDATKYEAWLGVAAMTSNGKYIETANKNAGNLTETDKNVATFKTEGSESSASQTFYLNKATSAAAVYTIAAPVATGGKTAAQYKEELTYAQVYELTAQTYADADALVTALKTQDVYEGTADTDGTTLTLIPAGTTSYSSFNTSNKYFTAGTTNSLTTMADGKKYVYGEAADGSDTAFRYIGKLGQGKTDWSDTQIDEMHIAYSIYGLTDGKYADADVDATYGLYIPVTGPQVTLNTSGEINITNLEGAYTSFVLNDGTDDWPLAGADGEWTEWDDAADAEKTFQLGDNWMSGYLAGKTVIIKVGLSDGTTIESSPVTFPEA